MNEQLNEQTKKKHTRKKKTKKKNKKGKKNNTREKRWGWWANERYHDDILQNNVSFWDAILRKKKKKIAINVICQLVRKFRLMRREECTSELFLYNLPKRIYIYIYAYTCISSTWLMLNLNSIKSRRTTFFFNITFLRK